jgi:hypothetical protein
MLLSSILLGATALSGVLGIPAPAAEPEPKTSISVVEKRKNFWFAGVNESGAEFGSGNIPGTKGTDYTWPLTSSVDVSSIATVKPGRSQMTNLMSRHLWERVLISSESHF